MDRNIVAKELIFLAKELLSMEFGTKEEMEQYKKDHDVRPGTKLTVEKDTKKEPAKQVEKVKSLTRAEHTHSFGKLSKGDEAETKVRVYDNGGKTADRYSVVVEGKDWESSASPGYVNMLSLSEGGEDVSQWGDGKEGGHLGSPVKWESLGDATRKHIEKRLRSSGE